MPQTMEHMKNAAFDAFGTAVGLTALALDLVAGYTGIAKDSTPLTVRLIGWDHE